MPNNTTKRERAQRGAEAPPRLLAGGSPQIPKGYGEEAVQAWIAAAPGWKGERAGRLDALISAAAPQVHKAVKWNTPMYGVEEDLYFTAFHAFERYLKITFFRGAELVPMPPEPSKQAGVRYFHVQEHEALPEAQLLDWFQQAARLPGAKL